jgi:hypothetical protein
MVRTRREALLGVGSAIACLSGCTGGRSTETPSPTATARPNEYDGTTDPATRTVRNPSGEPAVKSTLYDPSWKWDDGEWLVADRDDRDALFFADDAEGVESARSFVARTDLSAGAVLIHQYRVKPCEEWSLERLRWRAENEGPPGRVAIELSYRRVEREGECAENADRDVAATFVRVPAGFQELGAFTVSVG